MAFAYKRTLTIDHTKCGSANSSAFPVLVSINHSTFKNVSGSGHITSTSGYDIIFTSDSAGTTKIPWEIESYDSTNGLLTVWVQVATISSTVDTVFYCFFGDASVTTAQNTGSYAPTAVWDTNYKGVWHLPDGSSLSLSDSTGLNTATNHSVGATTGKIAGGGSFSAGSSQYIDAGGTVSTASSITVEAWMFPSATATYERVLSNLTGSTYNGFELYHGDGSNSSLSWQVGNSGTLGLVRTTSSTFATATWHHVVGTITGTTMLLYVDGVLPAQTQSPVGSGIGATTSNLHIGRWSGGATSYFDGLIDEVRVSNVVRPPSWVTSSYNNQTAPGNIGTPGFITYGSETSIGGTIYTSTLTAVTATMSAGVAKKPAKVLTATTAVMSGLVNKKPSKFITGTMASMSAATAKTTAKVFTATTAAMSGLVVKNTSKVLAATMAACSAIVSGLKAKFLALTATMASFAGAVNKRPQKALNATSAAMSGMVTRATAKALQASTATMSGLVQKATAKGIMATTAGFAGSVTKAAAKKLAATMASMSGTVTKATSKTVSAVMSGWSAVLATLKGLTLPFFPRYKIIVAADTRRSIVPADSRTFIVPRGD
jgi:hypothetical protein